MSALTETTSSPTLVGFPSHLTPSATFRPSQCNLNPKKGLLLRKFGLNQLIWNSLMMPIRLKLPSLSSNGLSTHQNWCTEKTQSGEYSEVTDAKYETQTDANGNDQTVAMALVNEGGAYVVEDEVNVGAVVAIVFAGLVFIGAIMFIVWWKFFKAPPAADEYSVNYSGTGTNA